jgi:hypothetical protein
VVVEYVPAPHRLQPDGSPVPVQYVPAGQSVHAERPALAANVPAGQAAHTASWLELQDVKTKEPVGHCRQPRQYAMSVSLGMSTSSGAYSPE